ncbi:hypothetical protein [Herbidospora cretacea]|uniref:hypothetical protein n=1 Tax=Herbidospora cretacea TaxID=28444 RepID=UPI000AB4F04D|nr:hypothetical protein [Herbidospora cretacea]
MSARQSAAAALAAAFLTFSALSAIESDSGADTKAATLAIAEPQSKLGLEWG